MHDASTVVDRNEVGSKHLPGVFGAVEISICEIVKQWRVAASDEIATSECVDSLSVPEFCLVRADEGFRHDVPLTIAIEDCVVNVRSDCEGKVRRQRPRRRRPGDHVLARLKRKLYGERWILAILVDVVHPSLSI